MINHNHKTVPRPPEPNVQIPWDYIGFGSWGPQHSVVDLYKEANRGHREKKCQVYGKRVNRKWAVS